MNKEEKFKNFLESLKDGEHDNLIESVKKGFNACLEYNLDFEDYNAKVSGGSGSPVVVNFDLIFAPKPEEINACPVISKLFSQYMENTEKPLDEISLKVIGTYKGTYSVTGTFTEPSQFDPGGSPDIHPEKEEYLLSVKLSDDNANEWPEEPIKLENEESPDYKLALSKAELLIDDKYSEIYDVLTEVEDYREYEPPEEWH